MDAVTRISEAVITDAPQLADVWLEAAPALTAFLRSRGCGPQDADDLVQECTIRVLRSRPTFTNTTDLLRWCLPVIRNLSVDLHRKGRRELAVEFLPEGATVGDVADDVLLALELRRVLQALQQLRPSDREAIVAHVGPEQSSSPLERKEAVRRNVQRHRARQRLLVGSLPPSASVRPLGAEWVALRCPPRPLRWPWHFSLRHREGLAAGPDLALRRDRRASCQPANHRSRSVRLRPVSRPFVPQLRLGRDSAARGPRASRAGKPPSRQ